MNIPFPVINLPLVDESWFNSDMPRDEEAELTQMENEHKRRLNLIGQKFKKATPVIRNAPEPMEEGESEEEVIEESEETEESHDEDPDRNYPNPRSVDSDATTVIIPDLAEVETLSSDIEEVTTIAEAHEWT